MDYKLSAKQRSGKWWSYGRFTKNKFGNLQASFKRESLLKLLADTDGEWINLAAFPNDLPQREDIAHPEQAPKVAEIPDDDIPF